MPWLKLESLFDDMSRGRISWGVVIAMILAQGLIHSRIMRPVGNVENE
jgi:hypothetical protein